MIRKRTSCIYKINEEDFKKIIIESYNYSDAIRNCGYTNVGNTRILKERIQELNLDTSHFIKNNNHTRNFIKKSNDKIFTENSKHSRSLVKRRLIEDFKWEWKCNSCNRTEWCSRTTDNKPQKISLELEHINGINNDNRIENLEFLCPLCHSYTSTWRTKNKKKIEPNKCIDCNIEILKKSTRCNKCNSKSVHNRNKLKNNRPSLEQLEKDLETLSFVATGKKYNVTDNAVRKWIKLYKKY